MKSEQVRQDAPRHIRNAAAVTHLNGQARAVLDPVAVKAAFDEITSWPGYAPTPLVPLPGVAARAGVGTVLYKDESHRFGLGSFKALGGAYAVLRVVLQKLREQGIETNAAELMAGAHRNETSRITVVCATDGNHGRSVAWGAQMFGCLCRIYIHENVSADREAGIAVYGAEVIRLAGDYDESVRICAREADQNGWTLVADTNAGGGSDVIPTMVTQGYTIIVHELLDQLNEWPTHVFIPAGVGGLAAAVSGQWALQAGTERPRMIVVEPHAADCVFRALRDGDPRPLEGNVNSFMACLSAGEVSPVAWPVLRQAVNDVVTIADRDAIETLRALADGRYGDAPLVSGESGCAPVAALLALRDQPAIRAELGLNSQSRVLAIGSEGATAPEVWESVVGRSPQRLTCDSKRFAMDALGAHGDHRHAGAAVRFQK